MPDQQSPSRLTRSDACRPCDPLHGIPIPPLPQTFPIPDSSELPRSAQRHTIQQKSAGVQFPRNPPERNHSDLRRHPDLISKCHQTQGKTRANPSRLMAPQSALFHTNPTHNLRRTVRAQPKNPSANFLFIHQPDSEIQAKSIQPTHPTMKFQPCIKSLRHLDPPRATIHQVQSFEITHTHPADKPEQHQSR